MGARSGRPPERVGDGFIGDGGDATPEQVPRLLRIRREVEVGEQHLPRAQARPFRGLRFLHLHDHVGFGEDLDPPRQRSAAPAAM
jgi:hypothetical protein